MTQGKGTVVADDDPLAGLGDVPWATLQHAYGSAGDTPGHIERMWTAASTDDIADSCTALDASILHQGSVYSATAPALRFLLPLLGRPDHPAFPHVVGLLDLVRDCFAYGDEAEVVLATRAVVVEHGELIERLFGHEDPITRSTAVGFATLLEARDGPVGRALADRWPNEPDDAVAADLLMSAAEVATRTGDDAWVRTAIDAWWADGDPFRRVAAASAWSRLDPTATEPMAVLVAALPAGVVGPGEPHAVWWGVGRPGLIVELWSAQDGRDLNADLGPLIDAIVRSGGYHAEPMLGAVLDRLFPDAPAGLPDQAADLEPIQRRALVRLAQHPELFRSGRIVHATQMALHRCCLPPDAPSITAWLDGAPRFDCLARGVQHQILTYLATVDGAGDGETPIPGDARTASGP